ncbi:MAG: hypothetical protein V9G24_21670 [Rhodoblastus sp.]
MIDRAGQRAPTPDYPIADAMLQVMVPLVDGTVRRKGVRINYVMPPASPYGDTITLRVSNYRTASDLTQGSLALLCQNRLPPVPRPKFDPKDFPRGNGILTPEAANYLLSVMVHGGTLVIAGTTGSGKTFVGQRILAGDAGLLPAWCDPFVYCGGQQRDYLERLEWRWQSRHRQHHLHRDPS